MWRTSLRDLQFRRRRFVIAIIATALCFGLTLVLDGLVNHVIAESSRIVALFGADKWLVSSGGSGPFTTTRLAPQTAATATAGGHVDPFLLARENVGGRDVNVVGYVPGGAGEPHVASGRLPSAPGEVVTDTLLNRHPGDHIRLGGTDANVVGTARNVSYYFGGPTVFATLADVQNRYLGGQPLVSGFAVRGDVASVPPGLRAMTNKQVIDDLNRPSKNGVGTVRIINGLLWIVAAGIVASMVYLSVLERTRDLAVFKAIGTRTRSLFGGLALQSLVLAGAAAVLGAVVSLLMAPAFPMPVDIPASSYAILVAAAIGVALIASLVGLRRAVGVDPALAFGR
jgi:putative ABC transport system permease protein